MLVVTATPLPALSDLAPIWLDLESRAQGSFFTSWTWIGTWLSQLSKTGLPLDRLTLFTARRQNTVVGLGITSAGSRKWRSLGQRPIVLHQAGRLPEDSIYIEYNDFLVDAAVGPSARTAFLRFLDKYNNRRPFCVNAADESLVDALASTEIPYRILRVETCSYVDFTQVPASAAMRYDREHEQGIAGEILGTATEAYLTGLSRNSRQQIRRSIRLAERDGPLRLVRAANRSEAALSLRKLAELHTAAWNTRKRLPGAFVESFQMQFVAGLVDIGCTNGTVDLLRIEAGTHTVGVLLNFVHGDDVYAYQSGFAYIDDNRFKPGLLCHTLAAAYYKIRERSGYHFMAGASRYKNTLSNATEKLYWLETRHCGLLSRIRR